MARSILIITAKTESIKIFRMDMILSMLNNGHKVTVLGEESTEKWESYFNEFGIKYYSYNIDRNGINPIKDIKTIIELYKKIHFIKPDKLFLYQAKSIIYGLVASRKMESKKFTLVAGLGSIYRGKGFKNKIIRAIMNIQYKLVLNDNEKVFFHNDDDKKLFVESKLVSQEKSVVVAGSGVNMEVFQHKPLPEKLSFLFVGRLIRDKGINEFLEAAECVKKLKPEVSFNLVGSIDSNPTSLKKGELKYYIENNIINYHGNSKEVQEHIYKNKIFVLPSYHEGLPKSIIEAMAVGRPIITTDVPGCRETVVDGKNGLIIKSKSTEELVGAMLSMIEEQDLHTMAKCSYEISKEKFDVRIVNEVILREMNLGGNEL